MSKPSSTPLESALLALTASLQPARRAWTQEITRALERFGLALPLALVLVLLGRKRAAMRQSELADAIGVNAGAMVRTLDQAERLGLVERRGVAGDRRANEVHITDEGIDLAGRMEVAMSELRLELLGDLPLADVEAAVRVLGEVEARCGGTNARSRMLG
ncbi:MarR family transcriptional regulator [Sphingomonas sp. HF-S3]|uniref:MarR family transcriptional regulator n=1 Tax=Sphingomonas rustica TaxID=3103142 RepID=A0ABV0BEY6_9SPHN